MVVSLYIVVLIVCFGIVNLNLFIGLYIYVLVFFKVFISMSGVKFLKLFVVVIGLV